MSIRIGVPAALAARVGPLAARLAAVVVELDGDIAARRAALRRDEVDVAVHPLSELATEPADDVELVAVPRPEPHDARLPAPEWAGPPEPELLGLETATGLDAALRRRVAKLDHAPTRLLARAEGAVLAAAARDGLRVAVASLREDGLLFVTATRYAPDGAAVRTASHAGYPEDDAELPERLAARVVAELTEPPTGDTPAG